VYGQFTHHIAELARGADAMEQKSRSKFMHWPGITKLIYIIVDKITYHMNITHTHPSAYYVEVLTPFTRSHNAGLNRQVIWLEIVGSTQTHVKSNISHLEMPIRD